MPAVSTNPPLSSPVRLQLHWGIKRFVTGGTGKIEERWRKVDSFEVRTGSEGGVIYLYWSEIQAHEGADVYLKKIGYEQSLGRGIIDAQIEELRFGQPHNCDACKDLLHRMAEAAL